MMMMMMMATQAAGAQANNTGCVFSLQKLHPWFLIMDNGMGAFPHIL